MMISRHPLIRFPTSLVYVYCGIFIETWRYSWRFNRFLKRPIDKNSNLRWVLKNIGKTCRKLIRDKLLFINREKGEIFLIFNKYFFWVQKLVSSSKNTFWGNFSELHCSFGGRNADFAQLSKFWEVIQDCQPACEVFESGHLENLKDWWRLCGNLRESSIISKSFARLPVLNDYWKRDNSFCFHQLRMSAY